MIENKIDGKKAKNSFKAAVANTPSTNDGKNGTILDTKCNVALAKGTYSSTVLMVVQLEMKTTMGDQKMKRPNKHSHPSHSEVFEPTASAMRFSYTTSFGSGGALTMNSVLSARKSSFSASRCQSTDENVTKPDAAKMSGERSATMRSTFARSAMTNCCCCRTASAKASWLCRARSSPSPALDRSRVHDLYSSCRRSHWARNTCVLRTT
mmetsp:Transcript_38664/g.111693  ORF Transcript_38664/g.111693 Transcript_38664/m.111693 type:complete len:209 (-) Transcript_38664:1026-1652(-)